MPASGPAFFVYSAFPVARRQSLNRMEGKGMVIEMAK